MTCDIISPSPSSFRAVCGYFSSLPVAYNRHAPCRAFAPFYAHALAARTTLPHARAHTCRSSPGLLRCLRCLPAPQFALPRWFAGSAVLYGCYHCARLCTRVHPHCVHAHTRSVSSLYKPLLWRFVRCRVYHVVPLRIRACVLPRFIWFFFTTHTIPSVRSRFLLHFTHHVRVQFLRLYAATPVRRTLLVPLLYLLTSLFPVPTPRFTPQRSGGGSPAALSPTYSLSFWFAALPRYTFATPAARHRIHFHF